VQYPISDLFGLNRNAKDQTTQKRKKVWILKPTARKTAEKSSCVRTKEVTDQDQASPEKGHSSLVRYWISDLFGLIELQKSKLCNSARNFGFRNSGPENRLHK
jgi:hypothetical protein